MNSRLTFFDYFIIFNKQLGGMYMKKLYLVFFALVLTINLWGYAIPTANSDFRGVVNKDLAIEIAKTKFSSVYNVNNISVGEVIPYVDWNGMLYAYLVPIFYGGGTFPQDMEIESDINTNKNVYNMIKKVGNQKEIESAGKKLWGVDRFGYVLVSARKDNMPILEVAKGMPYYFMSFSEISEKASLSLRGNVKIRNIVYIDHANIIYKYTNGDKNIYIEEHFKKVFSEEKFNKMFKKIPFKMGNTHSGWIKIENNKNNLHNIFKSRATGYIADVPFFDWSYGCSPTTSAMMFDYWDPRGYSKLTDYYFDRWDCCENEMDCNITNVQRELAIAMGTDTTTGGTYIGNIDNGQRTVAISYNGYTGSTSTTGSQGNITYGWQWDRLTGEIDGGFPCHFDVLNYWSVPHQAYIGHSVVAVGYDNDGADSLVIVHDTWSFNEPYWSLYTYHNGTYSYHYFTNFRPAGGNTAFTGRFADIMDGSKFLSGKYGNVVFDDMAISASYVKLYYSNDNFQNTTLIDNTVDPFSDYLWQFPDISPDTTKSMRMRLEVYNSSNTLISSDGTFEVMSVFRLTDTLNFGPQSFFSTQSQPYSVTVKDTLAFICRSGSYMDVLDISNLNDMIYLGSYSLPSTFLNFQFIDDTLIAASGDTKGFIIAKMDDNFNVTLVDSINLNNKNVLNFKIDGNRAVIAAKLYGLSIVDITDPTSIFELGYYNNPPFFSARDVYVKGDTAYVAAGTKGVIVLDISDPTGITVLSDYNSPGNSNAISVKDNTAYVADGANGTILVDITDANSISLIDVIPKRSNVNYCNLNNDGSLLFVSDGKYYDVIVTSKDTSGGYIQMLGNVGIATPLPGAKGTTQFIGVDYNYGMFIFDGTPAGIVDYSKNVERNINFSILNNPVRNIGQLQFSLNKTANVSLNLYDASGRKVSSLLNSSMNAGRHSISFKTKNLAKGLYFAQLNIDNKNAGTKKVIVLR